MAEPVSGTRLNRYLALAGMGTRRSVERLITGGRISLDGAPAADPAMRVAPGQKVTLDGRLLVARQECGVLVGLVGGRVPAIAHPADLHEAGINEEDQIAALVSDAGLAARLRRGGFDPARLGETLPEPGEFRPLSPSELQSAALFARRVTRRK
jgi:S4 domain